MKIEILTTFPEMLSPLQESMMKRSIEKGLVEITVIDIRDFTLDKHNRTDDYPFGGGHGMLMTPEPIFRALESIGAEKKKIIYMSPRGKILEHKKLKSLSQIENLVILCGHYEGIDQRVIEFWGIEEISIGDYILTGGEPAAVVLVEAVSRLIPGFLSEDLAAEEESIYSGLIEYDQYTRPRNFRNMEVPETLL
ncbi:MAG: tRNA (guanosine(37)-N1)-methyltransferase TrmD, partial [Anaerovoracaceae bacterium]